MGCKGVVAVALVAASFGLAGCPVVLIGAGAAGGYAISRDSVKNQFDLSKDRVYRRSLDVVKKMGQVTTKDPEHGLIQAKVGDTNVKITVKPLTKKTVELEVQARDKLLLPKVDVAQDVYNKIIEKL